MFTRMVMMVVLSTLCACDSKNPPLDTEDALEWYAERIEDAVMGGHPDNPYCSNETLHATEHFVKHFNIRSTYRNRHESAVVAILTAAERCADHERDHLPFARLARTLGDNARAESAARKEAQRLLASTYGLLPAISAHEVVEEFNLDDLHDRAIAFGQERFRQFAQDTNKPLCTLDVGRDFTTKHPLPECTQ